MRGFAVVVVVGLAACKGGEPQLTFRNPEISLVEPVADGSVASGTPFTIHAIVTFDPGLAINDLDVRAYVDGQPVGGSDTDANAGIATFTSDQDAFWTDPGIDSEGPVQLKVTVTDPHGGQANAEQILNVTGEIVPTVDILTPLPNANFPHGDAVAVTYEIVDGDQPATDDELVTAWVDGVARDPIPATVTDVHQLDLGVLALGAHQVLLRAQDNATRISPDATVEFSVVAADRDGDGFSAVEDGGDDCADGDGDVHPGAAEVCNGRDDDCDGVVDDHATDPLTYFLDNDNDGYGDNAETERSCEQPTGYVAQGSDCDDTLYDVHPTAPEICNDRDDDCDLQIDEGAALGSQTWFLDSDHDAHGSAFLPTQACTAPAGYVGLADDCDDSNGAVYPGAVEVCNGVDDDCDGAVDEGASDAATYYADADGDGFGDPSRPTTVCDRPNGFVDLGDDCDDADPTIHDGTFFYADADRDGYGEAGGATLRCAPLPGELTDGTDCDDTQNDINPGEAEVCDGVDQDCNALVDDDPVDGNTYYDDDDGDGYGDDHARVIACTRPAGALDDYHDCNDHDSHIHPGVAEICGNGIDEDCDGNIDQSCFVDHCADGLPTTLDRSEFWDAAHIHRVFCRLTVEGAIGPTLTIEDGATVQFGAGALLYVATDRPGSLVADGSVHGITFTSMQPLPGPGDWGFVALGARDGGSVLDGVTIEYTGLASNGYAALSVSGPVAPTLHALEIRYGSGPAVVLTGLAAPAITDSYLHDNLGGGVLSDGLSSPGATVGAFSGNTVTANVGYPVSMYANFGDVIGADNVLSGNRNDAVRLLGDTLDHDQTWPVLDVPREIQGVVLVSDPSHPTLTVADGDVLRFTNSGGSNLQTGYGKLVADGSIDGVVFTGVVQSPGSWGGLAFGPSDTGSVLRDTEVSWAGGLGYGTGIQSDAPALILDHVDEKGALGPGFVASGDAAITDSSFTLNSTQGVRLAGTLSAFQRNTLTGNGSPILLPFWDADRLDQTSTYDGNVDDHLAIAVDTYANATTTLHNVGVPWLFQTSHTFDGAITPTLTIEAGTRVEFAANAFLYVGTAHSALLDIQPGVVFTSAQRHPAPGDWGTVLLGAGVLPASSVEGATFEYAGGVNGCAVSVNSSIALVDTAVRQSATHGLCVTGGRPEIDGLVADDNAHDGLHVYPAGELGSLTRTEITRNGWAPLVIPAQAVPLLDPVDQLLTGNGDDTVYINGGDAYRTATWSPFPGVDYVVTSSVYVRGPTQPVLTIAPGTTLYFGRGTALDTDGSAGLVAVGTAVAPVVFTSSQATPAPGDWGGLVPQGATVFTLQHAVVEYAGQGYNGTSNTYAAALTFGGYGVAVPTISDTVFQHSSGNGIWWGMYNASFLGANVTFNDIAALDNAP